MGKSPVQYSGDTDGKIQRNMTWELLYEIHGKLMTQERVAMGIWVSCKTQRFDTYTDTYTE